MCYESYGERVVSTFLEVNNIKYIRNHTYKDCINIKVLRFDFYLIEYNICIEFDGIQHHEPKTKMRDKIKDEYCKNNNIQLIRISEITDIKNKLNFLCQ